MMKTSRSLLLSIAVLCTLAAARGQAQDACSNVAALKLDRVEITKAELIPAGFIVPPPYPGAPSIGPLPTHCRVDGILNRRKGVGGEEFGIRFAIALPQKEAWNGDFMMQGRRGR